MPISGDYSYSLDGSNNATIIGYLGAGGDISIPATVDGYPVVAIGVTAFQENSDLTSVIIPEGVVNVDHLAFNSCSSLVSVTLPSSLTNVGDGAFASSIALVSATFNGDAPTMGTTVFHNTHPSFAVWYQPSASGFSTPTWFGYPAYPTGTFIYTPDGSNATITGYTGEGGDISIPAVIEGYSVVAIGASAFSNQIDLTSVIIPVGVISIGDNAFAGCTTLTSIAIPSSVTSIGIGAFSACTDLISVDFGYGSLLTTIGSSAFHSCSNLASITLPDGVTEIGTYVFTSCAALASVSASGVTSIAARAFQDCSLLSSVMTPNVTSIGLEAFQNCVSLVYFTIPAGVTSIGTGAFQYCEGLVSAEVPEGVTDLPASVFEECYDLDIITLPSTLVTIGNNVFQGCSSFESITLPIGLTSIGDEAFGNCEALTSIIIPAGVDSIGDIAFNGCSALTSATFEGNAPSTMGTTVFEDTDPSFTVYFQTGATGFTTPTWPVGNGDYPTEEESSGPVITVQPQDQHVPYGEMMTLTVDASSSGGDLHYDWFQNESPVGWVDSTYQKAMGDSDIGVYYVNVSDDNGTTKSFDATVQMNVRILTQPTSQRLAYGDTLAFSVDIDPSSGVGPLSYDWYRDGTAVGLTEDLVISPFTIADVGTYHLEVSDDDYTDVSDYVDAEMTPPHIITQPIGDSIPLGNPLTLIVEAEGGVGTVHYQWHRDSTSIGLDSSAYHKGSVSAGDAGDYYVEVSDDLGSENSDIATVTVTGGATYTVTYNGNTNTGGTVPVDGTSYASGATVTVLGNTGSLTKTGYTFNNWNTAANGSGTPYNPGATFSIGANVTLYAQWLVSGTAPVFTTHPASQKVELGGRLTLSAGVTGTLPIHYTWRKNEVSLGAPDSNSFNKFPYTKNDAGTYRVDASNSFGSAQSQDATVSTAMAITYVSSTYKKGPSEIQGVSFGASKGSGKVECQVNNKWVETKNYSVWSNERLVVEAPPQSGMFSVRVTNNAGDTAFGTMGVDQASGRERGRIENGPNGKRFLRFLIWILDRQTGLPIGVEEKIEEYFGL